MRILMLSAALAAVLIQPAFGGDDNRTGETEAGDSVTVNSLFGRFGFSSSPHVTASSCSVEMGLNQKTFIENLPQLQQMGMLNPDITQTRINSEPNMLSMAFALQMLPVATKEVYESNKEVDRCEFSQSLSSIDDYGNDKKITVLTYQFTRALYKKINWDNIQAQSMMKIAPKFHMSPEFGIILMKEKQGS